MTSIKLENLSPKELQDLIDNASAQMDAAHEKNIQSAKEKIEAVLKNHELSIEDIFPVRATRKSGKGKSYGKRPKGDRPMYVNPADPSQTWLGMGRPPLWYTQALKKRGVTRESLLAPGTRGVKKTAGAKAAGKKSAGRRGRKPRAQK
jgi:DNA-binding protein H-NS